MPEKTEQMESFSQQLGKQADLSACPGFSSLVAKYRSWLKEETDPHVLSPVRTARLQELRNWKVQPPSVSGIIRNSSLLILEMSFCLSPLCLYLLSLAPEKYKPTLL